MSHVNAQMAFLVSTDPAAAGVGNTNSPHQRDEMFGAKQSTINSSRP